MLDVVTIVFLHEMPTIANQSTKNLDGNIHTMDISFTASKKNGL